MAQIGDSLRVAVAVAVVKAKRERESEARRWRLRASELEAELQSLVRFIGTPVLELFRSGVQRSSGHPSLAETSLSTLRTDPEAEAEHHVPSTLELLLEHMLSQALARCRTAEAIDPSTSLPPSHLDLAAQLELQQRSNNCQLAPGTLMTLEQRAHALRQLLHGMLALSSTQQSVAAICAQHPCATPAANAQATASQPIPVPATSSATTMAAQPMHTPLRNPDASIPPLHTVLHFVLGTLIFLPASDLRKLYIRHSVDLLAALLHIGSAAEGAGAAGTVPQAGTRTRASSEVLGNNSALPQLSAQQDGQRSGPWGSSVGCASAPARGGGPRVGSKDPSTPWPNVPPNAAAMMPSQDASCSGSILAAVDQLLEVCRRSSSSSSSSLATAGKQCPSRQQGGAAAVLPTWPTPKDPLPEACQALLNEMVASSPHLGQLVMVACSAALQRSTSLLMSMFAQNEAATTERASGLGAPQRQQLARVASAAAGAQEFDASLFQFGLLDSCVSKVPAWCKAESQRKELAQAHDRKDCSHSDQLLPSYLHQSTDQLLSMFAMLPSLHQHLPLFCASALRTLAAMATALQLVAISPEFASCGKRAECMELCKKVKAALVPSDRNGTRG